MVKPILHRKQKGRTTSGTLSILFLIGAAVLVVELLTSVEEEELGLSLLQQQLPSSFKGIIDGADAVTQLAIGAATFPLVLGDPTLTPIHLLENNFTLDKQYCDTFQAPKGDFVCHIEWDEWMTSKAFVQPGDVVIEFGGRFGTTACILSRSVGANGAVVTVEPDRSVQGYLMYNRHRHQCGFHALLGTVSSKPMFIKETGLKGYGTQTTTTGEPGWASIPNMALQEVERNIGKKANVALIDCEGCISSVNETGLLDQVDLILLEEDGLDEMGYARWHTSFFQRGFKCLWYLKDTANPRRKAWARVRHSVWLRKGVDREYPSCEEYAQKTGLSETPTLFMCATCPEYFMS